MITIKPTKQKISGYKMLKFKLNGKIMGGGDTLTLNGIEPTEYLKIMVNENGNIELWTEDEKGNETQINWRNKK